MRPWRASLLDVAALFNHDQNQILARNRGVRATWSCGLMTRA